MRPAIRRWRWNCCVSAAGLRAVSGKWSGIVNRQSSATGTGTGRRYLALWFPFLSVDRLVRPKSFRSVAPGDAPFALVEKVRGAKTGRRSRRERACQYAQISVVAVSVKKTYIGINTKVASETKICRT